MRDPQDRQRFVTLLNGLATNFRFEASDPWIEVQWLALSDLPLEAFEKGVRAALVAPGAFMPTAGDLRALCGADTAAIRAARAWATVVEGIRRHGYTGGLDARGDNGLTHAAVRAMGGWAMLCRTDSDELHSFKAKRFGELYEAMAALPIDGLVTRPLIGESGDARRLPIGGLDERRALPAVEAKALVRT